MRKKHPSFYRSRYLSLLGSGTFTISIDYLMLLCDSIIVGQLIGQDGICAVNMIAPLVAAATFVSCCLPEGISIMYTRAIGAMDRDRADRLFGMGIIAVSAVSILMSFLLICFGDLYLLSCKASPEIYELAKEYFFFLPLYAPLLIFDCYLDQIVYSDGDGLLETINYAVRIVSNVILSIVLGKLMGIRGVMLATVLSIIVSLLILVLHFFKSSNTLHFAPYFSFGELVRSVKYSIPDAIVYLLWGLMDFVLIGFVSKNYGKKHLVILAVVYCLVEMSVVFDGIGMAIQPLIGVYFGERNAVMIKKLMKDAEVTAFAEGIVSTVILLIFAPQIAGLFGIRNPGILKDAVFAIRIFSLTLAASSFVMLGTAYLLYIDRVGLSVGMLCLKDGILSILLPVLFSSLFGESGLWFGFAAAPVLGALLSVLAIRIMTRGEDFPWLLQKNSCKEVFVYDAVMSPESMTDASKKIRAMMEDRGYSKNDALQAALFVEEISTTVLERNGNDEVTAEYSLLFDDDCARLVIRDSGVIFDVTDPDLKITGLSSFVINGLLKAKEEKGYVPTTGYNRNMIRFDYTFSSEEQS
ncbi:MAG: hypothetical protein J5829_04115 [Lachnospiraceae bacterium]|nr:hypothetical protein [Lachnospiraceae bacterium]